ncbi:type VI secretion system membrane subunit TssM [Psychromonas aquimarina]|uniref:type VI secretion system membrane subunit TssM n=1 Tax=Psychromonas aquimarina TaxID=444919 RepID=UPI0009FD0442|nr:type VI secretion system membrane subunit TssM [Psychromonas aquimarina]
MKINKKLLLLAVLFLGCSAAAWFWIPVDPDTGIRLKLAVAAGCFAAALTTMIFALWHRGSEDKAQQHEQALLFKQDVRIITELFKTAVKQLRGVRAHKLKNLYELPWYILLGGEKGAKSSLLQQNNFEPVLHRSSDENDTNHYIRFWSNDNAVVIEIGHRLFDNEGIDDGLWRALSRQLLKYRPRQAVNAVISVIGCDQFLQSDKKQRQIISSNLQEAILVLGEHTGLSIPVYSVFTKSDAIADFVNFFESYSGRDVENPFGLTFPLDENHHFNSAQMQQSGMELLKNLSQQQFQLLHETGQKEAGSVIALPYQLRFFFERANEFLTNLGRENRVRQAVWLRGMYLLTTGKKGENYDLLSHVIAENASFNTGAQQPQADGRQSLFSSRLFSHVILPEADIIGVNRGRHYRYLMARTGYVLALGALITLFGLQLRDNWNLDEAFRTKATTELSLYRNDISRLREGRADLGALIPVLNELRAVDQQGYKPLPWYHKVSIKQSDTARQIRTVYQQQLQLFLLPQIEDLLSSELYVYVNLGNPSKVFELLRYYQMLFEPQRLDQDEMVSYLVDTLNDQGELSADSINQLSFLMADLFNSDYANVLKENDDLIAVAVQHLEGLSPERLIYARIKVMPEYRNRVDVRRQLGEKFSSMFSFKSGFHGYLLPELYTRQGHADIDLSLKSPLLKKQLNEFKSIQGDMSGASTAELAELSKKIQRLYYADYVYQWKELLKNIEIKDFASLADLAYAVKAARDPAASPIIDVLDAVVMNTTLAAENSADNSTSAKVTEQLGLSKTAEALKKADRLNVIAGDKLIRLQPSYVVNEAFSSYASFLAIQDKSAPVDELIAELDNLNSYFDSALTSSDPGKAWYAYAKAHAAGSQDALVTFRRLSSRTPGQVTAWVKALDQQAWKRVIDSGVGYLNRQWEQQVYTFYRQAIEGRFPFALQGRGEVALDDFAGMFKPQGLIDKFIKQELQPFVYWDNGVLKLNEIEGQKLPVSSETLAKIKQAKGIRELFFGPAGQELALQLRVKASSMSTTSTQFDIREAERLFSYRHGPRLWQDITWPSTGEDGYLSASFYKGENRIASKSYSGQWALFRIMFDGKSSATGDRRIRNLVYKLEDQDVILQYALKDSNASLEKGLLTSFYLPASLSE